jgi:hypothetical protein
MGAMIAGAWERWFFAPVRLARPVLLLRGTLFVLGLDCVVDLAEHGARYGIAGFNVAHFPWIDAIQPTPTPTVYVGVILTVGVACLGAALTPGRIPRSLLAAIAALYNWSWLMSMIDSYQHHYFLGLLLVAFVFFPQRTLGDHGAFGVAWGWVLACLLVAVVYAYTGRVKLEPGWLSGDVLRRVAARAGVEDGRARPDDDGSALGMAAQDALARMEARTRAQGGEAAVDRLWARLGSSVFPVQFLLAVAYVVAPLRDRRLPRWGRRVLLTLSGLALASAVAFHWAADAILELSIGWFGAYMIAMALVAFLPGPWLEAVVQAGRRGASAVGARLAPLVGLGRVGLGGSRGGTPADGTPAPRTADDPAKPHPEGTAGVAAAGVALLLGSLALLLGLGSVDLPGAPQAGIVSGAVVGLVGAYRLARGGVGAAAQGGLIASLAAVIAVAALLLGETRYDYWRFAGGDAFRRESWQEAATAYEKALRYAPADERGTDAWEFRARRLERARKRAEAGSELPPGPRRP